MKLIFHLLYIKIHIYEIREISYRCLDRRYNFLGLLVRDGLYHRLFCHGSRSETRLMPSLYTIIRASAAVAAGCCWLLLLLHECLQSTRNQSRRTVAHVCAYINMRACVRACGERKWTRDESRRRYNTDSTARPERLLNLSNEGSLHLSSGHGDGRTDKVRPSPSAELLSLPAKIPFTCLFARLHRFATSTSSDCAYRVNNVQRKRVYVKHTIENLRIYVYKDALVRSD